MKYPNPIIVMATLTLLVAFGVVNAQTQPTALEIPNEATAATANSVASVPAKNDTNAPIKTANGAADLPSSLVDAAKQYKASSTQLLTMQQESINKAEAKLDELRALVTEGLVAKADLETEEANVAVLRSQLQATEKQIADADNTIAEIQAEQQLAKSQAAKPVKLVSKQYGVLSTTATILRYNGVSSWSLGGLNQLQSFFVAKFGRGLPTSAVGQSSTHNRLGYDHRNAVDVALHPDSSEGRALINYLQSQGIPFLAFRAAVPGVATGPHIHIGSPSHRLS